MILSHVWGIFAHPSEEIRSVREKRVASPALYTGYLLVLAAIPPVCGYIGATQVGWRVGDGVVTKLTVASTIPLVIIAYFAILTGIVVVGLAINWMRETYTDLGSKDVNGIALATFISAPLLILSVVGLYPVIWVGMLTLIVAATYSVYLLYTCVPIAFQIPKERANLFASAILTIALVITVVLIITTVIIWTMFSPVFTN